MTLNRKIEPPSVLPPLKPSRSHAMKMLTLGLALDPKPAPELWLMLCSKYAVCEYRYSKELPAQATFVIHMATVKRPSAWCMRTDEQGR